MTHEAHDIQTWAVRLQAHGHEVRERSSSDSITLSFLRHTTITVGLEEGAGVGAPFMERYFICEPDAEGVFRNSPCPASLQKRWLQIVSQQTASYWRDFLAGPGSWLLTRLAHFGEVVFWSPDALVWPGLGDPTYRPAGMEIPQAGATFFASQTHPYFGPRWIDVGSARFSDVVAACFLITNYGGRDCYTADADGREIYLIDNDERVLVSIPDPSARQELLTELQRSGSVFRKGGKTDG